MKVLISFQNKPAHEFRTQNRNFEVCKVICRKFINLKYTYKFVDRNLLYEFFRSSPLHAFHTSKKHDMSRRTLKRGPKGKFKYKCLVTSPAHSSFFLSDDAS